MISEERAVAIATALMHEHGLDSAGWSFEVLRGQRKSIACCNSRTKTISVYSWILKADNYFEQEFKDTTIHEIAHAIAGFSAKHGPEWRAVVTRLGGTPLARSFRVKFDKAFKYRAACPCGFVSYRCRCSRKLKQLVGIKQAVGQCPRCGSRMILTENKAYDPSVYK